MVLDGVYTAKQVSFPAPSRQETNSPVIVWEASSPLLLFGHLTGSSPPWEQQGRPRGAGFCLWERTK